MAQRPECAGAVQTLHQHEQASNERQYAPRNVLEHIPWCLSLAQEHDKGRGGSGDECRESELPIESRRQQEEWGSYGDSARRETSTGRQVRQKDVPGDFLLQRPAL